MKQQNAVSNIVKGSFRGKFYRFSHVYLLWSSKSQIGPRGIDFNNNKGEGV